MKSSASLVEDRGEVTREYWSESRRSMMKRRANEGRGDATERADAMG
jgi:hypothetical protein